MAEVERTREEAVATEPAAPRRAPGSRPEGHHRDVQTGGLRAAVFGVSDGLVSNVGLILGVAGADTSPSVVRLAGLAGLIAGAVSMAAGEYNSMQVQRELFERELEMERRELHRNPHVETAELTQIYQSRGIDPDQARAMAQAVMRDPEQALEVHAREELGIAPGSFGSPPVAAAASLSAFAVGAVVPLLPWFFASGTAAILASLVLAVVAAVAVGWATARLTRRSRVRTMVRQVLYTVVPAGITYALGSVIGVTV